MSATPDDDSNMAEVHAAAVKLCACRAQHNDAGTVKDMALLRKSQSRLAALVDESTAC